MNFYLHYLDLVLMGQKRPFWKSQGRSEDDGEKRKEKGRVGDKIENKSNDDNGNAGDEEDLLELIESWDQVCDNEDALLMVNEAAAGAKRSSKIYTILVEQMSQSPKVEIPKARSGAVPVRPREVDRSNFEDTMLQPIPVSGLISDIDSN